MNLALSWLNHYHKIALKDIILLVLNEKVNLQRILFTKMKNVTYWLLFVDVVIFTIQWQSV